VNLEAHLTTYLHTSAVFSPTQHIRRAIQDAHYDHDTLIRWLLEQIRDRYDQGETIRNRLAKLAGALHRELPGTGPTKEELTAILKCLRSQHA